MEKVKIDNLNYWKIPAEKIFDELPDILPKPSGNNKPSLVTLHWSAGSYKTLESDYQILSTVDNFIYVSEDFLKYALHQHTWRRNTGNIGISFMGMFNKIKYPITDLMIENISKAQAVVKDFYNIPWENFHDHKYYSDLDNYGREAKWDCRTQYLENGKLIFLSEKVLQKSKWYHEKYLKK